MSLQVGGSVCCPSTEGHSPATPPPGAPSFQPHLVKFVDADDAAIGQDHGPALHDEVAGRGVPHHRGCQARRTAAFPRRVHLGAGMGPVSGPHTAPAPRSDPSQGVQRAVVHLRSQSWLQSTEQIDLWPGRSELTFSARSWVHFLQVPLWPQLPFYPLDTAAPSAPGFPTMHSHPPSQWVEVSCPQTLCPFPDPETNICVQMAFEGGAPRRNL